MSSPHTAPYYFVPGPSRWPMFAGFSLLVTMIGLLASAPLIKLTSIPYPAISAVIIPLVVLAAYLDMRSWFAIPILAVFSIIGLLMKRFGWPRPPFILGFILGPIIDVNIQTSFSLYGVVGTFTRPLTVVLFILVVLTAVVFTRFMVRAEETAKEGGGGSPRPKSSRWAPGPVTWRAENVAPLLMIAGAGAALWVALGYPLKAGMIPIGMSIGIIVLSAMELFKQMFLGQARSGQIMDLGMRSSGMEGATRAGVLLAELFALFIVLMMTIRLDNAAVVFAVLVPLVFLSGRQRWITGAITGGVITLWTYGFMGEFMAVIWPDPILTYWLLGIE